MKKIIKLLITMIIFCVSMMTISLACEQPEGYNTKIEQYNSSSIVFIGNVSSKIRVGADFLVTFDILKTYKGGVSDNITVTVPIITDNNPGVCGYAFSNDNDFPLGSIYSVYTSEELIIYSYSGNTRYSNLTEAEQAIDGYLNPQPQPQPQPDPQPQPQPDPQPQPQPQPDPQPQPQPQPDPQPQPQPQPDPQPQPQPQPDPQPQPKFNVPDSCKVWFDGCNKCTRSVIGGEKSCTKTVCDKYIEPFCIGNFGNEKNKNEESKRINLYNFDKYIYKQTDSQRIISNDIKENIVEGSLLAKYNDIQYNNINNKDDELVNDFESNDNFIVIGDKLTEKEYFEKIKSKENSRSGILLLILFIATIGAFIYHFLHKKKIINHKVTKKVPENANIKVKPIVDLKKVATKNIKIIKTYKEKTEIPKMFALKKVFKKDKKEDLGMEEIEEKVKNKDVIVNDSDTVAKPQKIVKKKKKILKKRKTLKRKKNK